MKTGNNESKARDEIVQEALRLPPDDRAYVADRLEHSLGIGGFRSPELGKVWAAEITRRIEAYDRGETVAVDFDEMLGRMRRQLAEHRGGKAGG